MSDWYTQGEALAKRERAAGQRGPSTPTELSDRLKAQYGRELSPLALVQLGLGYLYAWQRVHGGNA